MGDLLYCHLKFADFFARKPVRAVELQAKVAAASGPSCKVSIKAKALDTMKGRLRRRSMSLRLMYLENAVVGAAGPWRSCSPREHV